MAKIKFDLTDSDPAKAMAGTGEPPRPAVYRCRINEVNPGYSKNDDGSEDKNRPRIQVIMSPVDGPSAGYPLYHYLTFGKSSKWKLDQFLQSVGIASEKKRKGEFDPEKLIGKIVKVRVRAGKNQDGDYRAEVGSVMPDDGKTTLTSVKGDDDLTDDDDVTEEEETEEETEDEESEEGYTLESLQALVDAEDYDALEEIRTELGVDDDAWGELGWEDVPQFLVDFQSEESDEEEEDDDDEAPF